jgi:hypothetical protein
LIPTSSAARTWSAHATSAFPTIVFRSSSVSRSAATIVTPTTSAYWGLIATSQTDHDVSEIPG